MIVLAAAFIACEENEVMPSYTTKGTATTTVATISPSTTKPLPSESITLTMTFVNPSSDPLSQIILKAQVGSGDFTELQTFSISSSPKDQEVTQTATYVVPASKGTKVTFDMVITSQKPYPQIKRASVTVQ